MNRIGSWIAMMLCIATIMVSFAACGNKKSPTPGTTSATDPSSDSVETAPLVETDENGYVKDSLPASVNLDREFRIYAWQEQKQWEWCDEAEYPTALLDQALYRREEKVQDRFGVTLVREYHPGSWDFRNQFVSDLAKSVQLNDHAYDMVVQYLPAAGLAATQNLYLDLTTIPNLDFEKPWWPSRLLDTATVGSKLYFATGDISATFFINIHCIFANTQFYDRLNLSQYVEGRSIYEVVRDYDWTLETMLLLALDHVDTNEGNFGFTADNIVQADAFFYGGNFIMVKTGDNNLPALSADLTSQQLSDWYDKVQKIFTDEYEDVSCKAGANVFKQKKSIFHASTLSTSRAFAEEGLSFTALPIPMRDSDQEQYCTTTNFYVSMFSIPADVRKADESGMIMEALASEGYRNVTDVVYYNLFKTRYSSSNGADSAGMFDLVSNSVVFDGARMFADKLAMFATFRNAAAGVGEDPNVITKLSWPTVYAANEDIWKSGLISLISSIG